LRVLVRVCFRGSFEFELFFAFSLVCRFSCHLLVLPLTSFNYDQLHIIDIPRYVLYVVMLQAFPICENLVALYMHQFHHHSIPRWSLIGK
jgi:hypothetical protein